MLARGTAWSRWVASALRRARWAGRREPPTGSTLGRGPRRLLVAGMYGAYAAAVAAAMGTDWTAASRVAEAHLARDLWMFLGILAFGLTVFHLAASYGTVADLPGVCDAVLDGRLRRAKDAAFRTAYYVLFWLGLGAFVFVLIVGPHVGHLPTFTAASVVLARCGLVLTLPSAVLAWREPDAHGGAA